MRTSTILLSAGASVFALACINARKNNNPKIFYLDKLPGNYNGFILPPFGIFIKESERGNAALLDHEMTHWRQFQREGFVNFLSNYLKAANKLGYDLNPYEIEARTVENDYVKHNYTEAVRNGTAKTAFNPNFRK